MEKSDILEQKICFNKVEFETDRRDNEMITDLRITLPLSCETIEKHFLLSLSFPICKINASFCSPKSWDYWFDEIAFLLLSSDIKTTEQFICEPKLQSSLAWTTWITSSHVSPFLSLPPACTAVKTCQVMPHSDQSLQLLPLYSRGWKLNFSKICMSWDIISF